MWNSSILRKLSLVTPFLRRHITTMCASTSSKSTSYAYVFSTKQESVQSLLAINLDVNATDCEDSETVISMDESSDDDSGFSNDGNVSCVDCRYHYSGEDGVFDNETAWCCYAIDNTDIEWIRCAICKSQWHLSCFQSQQDYPVPVNVLRALAKVWLICTACTNAYAD